MSTPSVGVGFALLQAVGGRQIFGLGLNQRERDGLGVDRDLDAQGVIDAATRAAAGLTADDLDRAGGLLALD